MSSLSLRDLHKSYGALKAVDGLSLEVHKGEFVSLLGPSGCGKTTVLQMVAGFVQPDRGDLIKGGTSLNGIAANKRNIGIVFQSYALFLHMTIADNVGFGLEMRGIPVEVRERKIKSALDLVHLSGLGLRYPKQLSGGQQQRVALARALVIEPEVLLLDEPMSNLDAKLRDDMQIELRQLQRKLGITTVLVTHDQNEAMALSDRVAIMNHGRIIQIDSPSGAYEQPVDAFTSTFLGKANLLPCEIVSTKGNHVSVRSGDITFAVSKHVLRTVENGSFMCAIRPERIELVSTDQCIMQGIVNTILFLGNHWLLKVGTSVGDILVFRQNLGDAMPREGQTIGLSWHPENVRVVAEGSQ